MNKEVRRLIKELREQGWRVEKRTSKSVAFSPDGRVFVPIHHTPSDKRSMQNTISQLKRGGYRPGAGSAGGKGGGKQRGSSS